MVIGNLDCKRIALVPGKADPVSVVNPDAVLSFAFLRQQFQVVAGDCGQIAQLEMGSFVGWTRINLLPLLAGRLGFQALRAHILRPNQAAGVLADARQTRPKDESGGQTDSAADGHGSRCAQTVGHKADA